MSVKDELHELVDQLDDEPAGQLLDYARGLMLARNPTKTRR